MQDSLFQTETGFQPPLAARMRPTSLEGYVGQAHLVGPGKPCAGLWNRGGSCIP